MKTTVAVVVLNKYRLVYNHFFLCTVCCIQKYSAQQVQTAVHHQRTCIWHVVIWYQTLCLLQMVIPLLLSRQQGEQLDQNTYGMRNRRQNVYASLEVCIFWVGCLMSTTTVVGTTAARLFLFLFFPVQQTTSGIGHRVK